MSRRRFGTGAPGLRAAALLAGAAALLGAGAGRAAGTGYGLLWLPRSEVERDHLLPRLLNDRGQLAGFEGNPKGKVWLWDSDRITRINPPDTAQMALRGLNNRGQLLIEARSGAWVWQAGRFSEVPEVGPWGEARGINDAGDVVGSVETRFGSASWNQAALWHAGTVVKLGGLLPQDTGFRSLAEDINEQGVVVGEAQVDADGLDPRYHAFRLVPRDQDGDQRPDTWYQDADQNGVNDLMEDLGAFGSESAAAIRVNASGQILVRTETWNRETGEQRPGSLLWEEGSATELAPGTGVEAVDLNDRGQVIDRAGNLWQEGQSRSLRDLAPGEWLRQLQGGVAVNNRGQVAGTAWNHSSLQGFLLVPVEDGPRLALSWTEVVEQCPGGGAPCVLPLDVTLQNLGSLYGRHPSVTFFLSADQRWDRRDRSIGYHRVDGIPAGGSRQIRMRAKLRPGEHARRRYVIARVVNPFVDESEDGQAVVSGRIR